MGGYWETLEDGKHWRPPGYVGFRSADNLHRVDLQPGTKPMTLYIPGPFGLRKKPRAAKTPCSEKASGPTVWIGIGG